MTNIPIRYYSFSQAILIPILTILLLQLTIPSYCQYAALKWGKLNTEKSFESPEFIGNDKSSQKTFWLLRKRDGSYLVHFDLHDNKVFEKKLEYKSNSASNNVLRIQQILFIRNTFYTFYSSHDKKDNLSLFFLQRLTLKGDTVGKPVAISLINERTPGLFALKPSPDSTRILLAFQVPKQKGVDSDPLAVQIFDLKLRTLYEKKIILQDWHTPEIHHIELTDIIINNKNQLLIAGEKYSNKASRTGPVYMILKPDENLLKELSVKIPIDSGTTSTQIGNSAIGVDTNNQVIVSGFYSTGMDNQNKSRGGVFYGQISMDSLTVRNLKTSNLDDSLLSKQNNIFEYSPLDNLAFIFKDDGSSFLIRENITKGNKSYRLYFNDISITNFDPLGHLKYYTPLSKRQYFTNHHNIQEFSFFAWYDKSKSLKIVFNDHKENTSIYTAYPNTLIYTKSSKPVLVVIDEDGIVTKGQIVNTSDEDITLCPLSSAKLINDDVLFAGIQKHGYKIGRLVRASDSKPPSQISTPDINRNNRPDRTFIFFFGLNIGTATMPNASMLDWLYQNGLTHRFSGAGIDYNFPIKWQTRSTQWGIELGYFNNSSYFSRYRAAISVGKSFYISKLKAHSLFSLSSGVTSLIFKFTDKQPMTFNIQQYVSYNLDKLIWYISPSVKLYKVTLGKTRGQNHSGLGTGIDLGARIYLWQGNWKYTSQEAGGKSTSSVLHSVPGVSPLEFYLNIPIGLMAEKISTRGFNKK